MRRGNKGSSLDDWLKQEGIYEEVSAAAMKRVVARQTDNPTEEKRLSNPDKALKGAHP